jgi:hypothetical protein
MLKNILRRILVVIICQALVYSPLIRGGPVFPIPSGDKTEPKISQESYIKTVKKGADHQVTVTVTDNVGVKQVTLNYRTIGTQKYKHKTMDNIVKDDYRATIKSYQIKAPGVEYFVEAIDEAGNKSSAPRKSASLKIARQRALPPDDKVKPKISHEENYIDTVQKGADHQITVTVTDNVGVKQVTLYYRTNGTNNEYKRKAMDNIVKTDDYQSTIKSDQIKAPGLEYYVEARDKAGNKSGTSAEIYRVKMTDEDVAIVPPPGEPIIEPGKSSNTWLWVGLGVLAAVVAVTVSSSGGDDGEPSTATLNINASDPTQ